MNPSGNDLENIIIKMNPSGNDLENIIIKMNPPQNQPLHPSQD